MNIKKNLFKLINRSAATLFVVAGIYIVLSSPIFALTVNRAIANEIVSQDDQFDKKFREGRDLIDKEEWAKAAAKFSDIVAYPKNKSTDAALYWLAFCQKKQKQYAQTNQTLDRLLKEFPESSWSNDARVMQLEIAAPLGKLYVASAATVYPTTPNGSYSAEAVKNLGAVAIAPAAAQAFGGFTLGQSYSTEPRVPLDREDEIKIAAFQSLLAADPKRAIETMGNVLDSDSKASETLKQEILRVLRSPRISRTLAAGNGFNVSNSGVGKQFVPQLRETLVKSFQKEPNIKIRREIIFALAGIGDSESLQYLTQLYASEKSSEIKKAIINSFANSSPNSFGVNLGAVSPKRIELDKLMEIIRTEKDLELRRLAFSNLQRFSGWSSNEQMLQLLVNMYDDETDEASKSSMIRVFGTIKQNQISKKLMEIAKNDKSDKLRLEAIYALRTSNNPEVVKFLEDLIK